MAKIFEQLELGGKYAVSWPTIFLYAIPSSWVIFIFDQTRLGGSTLGWFALTVISYLATAIPLIAARYIVLPVRERPFRPVSALFVFTIASITRTCTAVPLALYLGLIPKDGVLYRSLSAPLNVIFWMILINLIVTKAINHSRALNELSHEKHLLEASESLVSHSLEVYRENIEERVQNELEIPLTQLQNSIRHSHNVQETEQSLTQLRLSLSSMISSLKSSSSTINFDDLLDMQKRHKKTRFALPHEPLSAQLLIAPFLVPFIVLYSGFIPTLNTLGWYLAVWGLIPATLFFAVALVIIRGRMQRTHTTSTKALAYVFLVYLLASLTPLAWLELVGFGLRFDLQAQFTATALAVGVGITILKIVELQRNEIQDDLKRMNAALSAQTILAKQRLWAEQQRLTTLLHGPIQAAIQFGFIQISKRPAETPQTLSRMNQEISLAISRMDFPEEIDSELFLQALEAIENLWGGICLIDCTVEHNVLEIIENDSVLARLTIDIVREAVTNAIKHGRATTVTISINQSSLETVHISVKNNGETPQQQSKSGFGTELLDQMTLRWELTQHGDFVSLSAEIPIKRNAPQNPAV